MSAINSLENLKITIDKDKPMTAKVINSVLIGLTLTAFSYAVGFIFGWIDEIIYLEAFAVVTSYACTWLCVVESRANYVIGVITTAAYCWLFIQFDLVASAIVNGYLVFSLIYGYFRWGNDDATKPVQRVAIRWLPVYALVTAAAYLGALGITEAFGGTLALTDSVILVGTILAQFLLDNKKIETWYVWAVVNVFAIYTYFNAGLALAGFQYIFFLINTVIGYMAWKRSMGSFVPQPAAVGLSSDDAGNSNDPLDPHGDGTLRPGDPLYDMMMNSPSGVVTGTQNPDGTWTYKEKN